MSSCPGDICIGVATNGFHQGSFCKAGTYASLIVGTRSCPARLLLSDGIASVVGAVFRDSPPALRRLPDIMSPDMAPRDDQPEHDREEADVEQILAQLGVDPSRHPLRQS